MTYQGRIQNGVVVLDAGAVIPDGTVVRVEPVSEPVASDAESQLLSEALLKLAGTCKGLPSDLARNLDHYLYGTQKRHE